MGSKLWPEVGRFGCVVLRELYLKHCSFYIAGKEMQALETCESSPHGWSPESFDVSQILSRYGRGNVDSNLWHYEIVLARDRH